MMASVDHLILNKGTLSSSIQLLADFTNVHDIISTWSTIHHENKYNHSIIPALHPYNCCFSISDFSLRSCKGSVCFSQNNTSQDLFSSFHKHYEK